MRRRSVPKGELMPKQYGPELRSPQAVEWMKGDGMAYLKASHQRALEIKARQAEYDTKDRRVRNQAEFQGGFTFDLAKRK